MSTSRWLAMLAEMARTPRTRRSDLWGTRARHFEQLEERILLSVSPLDGYSRVAPDWFAAPADESVSPDQNESTSKRWIVRLTPDTVRQIDSVAKSADLLNRGGVDFRVIRGLGLPGQLLVETQGASQAAVQASLGGNAQLAYFEHVVEYEGQARVVPDDVFFDRQWNLDHTPIHQGTPDADIDAPEAWGINTGSPQVVVAVIDSGIDYTHPDLYLNVWINQGEIPAAIASALVDVDGNGLFTFRDLNEGVNDSHVTDRNGTGYIDAGDLLDDPAWANQDDISGDPIDDDGNGFANDLIGWDFVNNDNDPFDDLGHGTHVAGTIAAVGNNGMGVAGVSWKSSLMPLKVINQQNRLTSDAAVHAVNYATEMHTVYGVNVPVTNSSWGDSNFSHGLYDAIEASGLADMLFVAAAGNAVHTRLGGRDIDQFPFYPASFELNNIITVAATDDRDQLSWISNYGVQSVDLAAPGESIWSTERNGGYGTRNGTSMAAPHVSGTAALIWSNIPRATMSEVREAILKSTDPKAELQSKVARGGRLNSYEALLTDTVPPGASLSSAPDITSPGGAIQEIVVNFIDNDAVHTASLNNNDVVVIRVDDANATIPATLVSVDDPANGLQRTAIYYVPAPGGTWDMLDNGEYQIRLQRDEVRDASNNFAREALLGSFRVNLATGGIFLVDSLLDAADSNPGDGQADDGAGNRTLRAALQEANLYAGNATVGLPEGVYTLAIPGADEDQAVTGDLDVTGNVTLRGAGADRTTIDAAGLDRIFDVLPGASLTLSGVTIVNGNLRGAGHGGGIRNLGDVSISQCSIEDGSSAANGGGVYNAGSADITDSLLSANSAVNGGAIYNAGTLTLTNSTLSGNQAGLQGGGLLNGPAGATSTVVSSTIADNAATVMAGVVDLERLGGDYRVNSSTDPIHTDPSVATSPSGTSVVVWESFDGTDYTILGQRYDADGVPQGGEFQISWKSPVVRAHPVVSTDDAGNFVVVWDEWGADSREFGIVARLYESNGTPRNVQFLLNFWMAGNQRNPSVAMAPNGTFVVVWDDDSGHDGEGVGVFGQRFAAVSGYRSGPLLQINGRIAGDQLNPEVAMDDDGDFVVVWQEAAGGGGWPASQIYARRFNSAGTALGNDSLVNTIADYDQAEPQVSVDADGDFAVVWQRSQNADESIHGQRFDSDGIPQGQEFPVGVAVSDHHFGGSVAMTPMGDFTVVWHSAPEDWGGRGMFGQRYLRDGTPLGTQFEITASSICHPTRDSGTPVAVDADGRLTVVSAGDATGNDWSIFAERFDGFPHDGGGIYSRSGGSVTIKNTLIARNVAANDWPDVRGSISSHGHNLVSDGHGASWYFLPGDRVEPTVSEFLGPLADNGGPTFTHELLSGSLAIDAGDNQDAPTADQRGFGRPVDADADGVAVVDVGAFERCESEIHGLVFHDLDADGSQGSAEHGLTGWTVFLDLNDSGTLEAGEPNTVTQGDDPGTPDTDEAGRYSFAGLEPRNYQIVALQEPGWTQTYPNPEPTPSGVVRPSVGWDGQEANNYSSSDTSMSDDGRYLAFSSIATNLVPGDTNGYSDVFVFDRLAGTLERVSVASDGTQANNLSGAPSVSADGRYVSFVSPASNLVPDDGNDGWDVFVHDRQLATTERVGSTYDGRERDGYSQNGVISADGRYVAFKSSATNLVPGDTNGQTDVFVYDLKLKQTERVNIGVAGLQANSYSSVSGISEGGRFVVFDSAASNMVLGDTNSCQDVFVRDRYLKQTVRVSLPAGGGQTDGPSYGGSISSDGRYIAIGSDATNLVPGDTNGKSDVFVHDRQSGSIERVSVASDGTQAASWSLDFALSADGRYVAFDSQAWNLVPGDNNNHVDIFVRDRVLHVTERVSLTAEGSQANSGSSGVSMSRNGEYVAFLSSATNLVTGDTNGKSDMFLRWDDLPPSPTHRVELRPGQLLTRADFGYQAQPGAIRGKVFNDLDEDGFADETEPGLAGWRIYVDVDDDNVFDDGTEPFIDTTEGGQYSFLNLPLRTEPYVVREVQQDDWWQTLPRLADDGEWTIDLAAGAVYSNIDFGNYHDSGGGQSLDGEIAGRVFVDSNHNRAYDAGETGLDDWTVYLDFNESGTKDPTDWGQQTVADNPLTMDVDEAGTYSFAGLSPDLYVARVVISGGTAATTPLGNQLSRTSVPTGASPSAIAAGDLNGDGHVDLAVANAAANDISILLNDGSGGYSVAADYAVGVEPFAVVVGLFDDDADLDLAVADYFSNTVSVLINNGDGSFASSVSYSVGYLPGSLTVGDFDGDQHPDLAVANEWDNNVRILRNTGNGTFSNGGILPVGASPFFVVAADLNGDDCLDLATANFDSNDVSVLLNNGDGTFVSAGNYPAGLYPSCVEAADLDGDGFVDLGVTDFGSEQISVFWGNGDGSFAPAQSLSAGPGPYCITAADMDSDGDLELVLTNKSDEHLAILRNRGGRSFEPAEGFSVGDLPFSLSFSLVATDLTGDGIPDLAVANGEANDVSVLLNSIVIGAHRVAIVGSEIVDGLDFGILPSDTTPPAVTLAAPDCTNDTTPSVTVTATDANTLPDGTTVRLDVDLNYDGDYLDAGEASYTLSALSGGAATFDVTPALAAGTYGIRARVSDQAANEGTSATKTMVVVSAEVVGRHIFYNRSAWDGNNAAADAADDGAIATDKQALLSGQKATYANYTSYSRGIIGIMIDIANLAQPAGLTVADFGFRTGNNNSPALWSLLSLDPALITVAVRVGAGAAGSDRVTILFPEGAVKKTWLQVTVKATDATGLVVPDVHYWGNAIGDSGDATANTAVNVVDALGVRANPHTLLKPAPIDDAYDYNRDKQVNVQDELIVRANPTTLLTDLNLIDLTGSGGAEGEGEEEVGSCWLLVVGVALLNQSVLHYVTPQPESTFDRSPHSLLSSATQTAGRELAVGSRESVVGCWLMVDGARESRRPELFPLSSLLSPYSALAQRVPLLNPCVFQWETFHAQSTSDRSPPSLLSSATQGESVTRAARRREPSLEALDRALTELLAEWDRL